MLWNLFNFKINNDEVRVGGRSVYTNKQHLLQITASKRSENKISEENSNKMKERIALSIYSQYDNDLSVGKRIFEYQALGLMKNVTQVMADAAQSYYNSTKQVLDNYEKIVAELNITEKPVISS